LYLRVRGYLAANCAQCHRPGGLRQTRDFRWETAPADTNICDAGAPFGAEVNPGNAAGSLLPSKMNGTAAGSRMPPLATDVIDSAVVSVVDEWINSLTTCQ